MSRHRWTVPLAATASLAALIAAVSARSNKQPDQPADKPPAQDQPYVAPATPGLAVGDKVKADLKLRDRKGQDVTFATLHKDKPVVLTFYRGGWCPFCTKDLDRWQTRMDDVAAAGAEFIAVTMEKPEYVDETIEKQDLDYRVLMDLDGKAAEAFKVKFDIDEPTQSKYKQWGLIVDQHNSNGKWQLPAPGTFVIDTDGVVRYAFADWDYKKRADPDEVLAALRELKPLEPPAQD